MHHVTTHVRNLLAGAVSVVMDTTLPGAVEYAEIVAGAPDDRVWFGMSDEEAGTDLSGEPLPIRTEYQVDLISRSRATVDQLASALRTLHDHTGSVESGSEGIRVWTVEVSSRSDRTAQGVDGENPLWHFATLGVLIVWERYAVAGGTS